MFSQNKYMQIITFFFDFTCLVNTLEYLHSFTFKTQVGLCERINLCVEIEIYFKYFTLFYNVSFLTPIENEYNK